MQYKYLKYSHFSSHIVFKFSFRTAKDQREIFDVFSKNQEHFLNMIFTFNSNNFTKFHLL